MRIERRKADAERSVLTGMLVARSVLGPIASRWTSDMFGTRWSNLVASWAVAHYRKYKEAPKEKIQDYFTEWSASNKDEETIGLVGDYLAAIDSEYESLRKNASPDYLLDQAEVLFNRVAARNLRDEIDGHLKTNDVTAAVEAINNYRRIEVTASTGINMCDAEEEIKNAFEITNDPLVVYDDALMGLLSPLMCRDSFVSFMGKEKVGKSFWLMDLAYRAYTQGRSVAYFEVGDMSQHQVLKRFASRAMERPVRADRWYYPTSMSPSDELEGRRPDVGTRREEVELDMTPAEAHAALAKLGSRHGVHNLKLSCHPNSSISVGGIESILETWQRTDGWHPDVVVVDYADILAAPNPGKGDTRDQINASWKAMRALSQRWHCLLVTATQADADSYESDILERGNFSEDKRKYSHVTACIGINQTDRDKEANLYRMNVILAREVEFSPTRVAWTAACLPIGNPCVLSTF